MTCHLFLPIASCGRLAGWVCGYLSLSIAIVSLVLAAPGCLPAAPLAAASPSVSAATSTTAPPTTTASQQDLTENRPPAAATGDLPHNQSGQAESGQAESGQGESGQGAREPSHGGTAALDSATAPLESRQRVVRAIRFAVVVVAALLAMLSTVVLLKINRLTHGKYMGRLWWVGVILVAGWLLAGWLWAWNNDFWANWLDGPLL